MPQFKKKTMLKLVLKMDQPRPLFGVSFSLKHIFTEKNVSFSGIRTRIVGLQGKHAYHYTTTTTTTALQVHLFVYSINS